MSTPRAILFDLGSVLLGYDGRLVFEAIQRLSPHVSPWEVFGAPDAWRLQQRAESGALSPAAKTRELNRLFQVQLPESAWAAAWAAGCTGPVPGMTRLVELLAPRFTLGCLSNTVPWHWATALRDVPALGLMQQHLISYELGCRKPGARIYELSLQALGLEGPQVLFVDDRPENIAGAERSGIRGILFEGAGELVRQLQGLGILQEPAGHRRRGPRERRDP